MNKKYTFLMRLFVSIMALTALLAKPAFADVNDFSFSSFDADYYLSKDAEGHSVMRVVENLTAEFRNYNQNRGIIRAIPRFYDGHSVSLEFESMQRNGVTEPLYERNNDGQFIRLSTRRDDYVNGTQKYTFTYTLRDVTKDFGKHQELYWDTNGTGWGQQFNKLKVTVHLDESVVDDFTNEVSCYEGIEGSNRPCLYMSGVDDEGRETIIFKSNGALQAGENLTYDLSFKQGTFVNYQMTSADYLPYILLSIATFVFMICVFVKFRFGRNHPGKGTIVAEYIPPKDTSILLSAEILGRMATGSMTAMLLDLAVQKKIKVIESDKKILGIFNTKAYILELINTDNLDDNQARIVRIFFPGSRVGSSYEMKTSDSSRARLIDAFLKAVKKDSERIGYRVKQKKLVAIQAILLVIMFGLVFGAFVLSLDRFNYIGVILTSSFIALTLTLAAIFNIWGMRPLTEKGRALYDYMKGLRLYIKMAEADRISYLQSPTGAEKEKIDTNDSKSMVVLYEKLLPYAVLFGQEKKWLKELSVYYASSADSPYWYSGTGNFNAATFASSVSSFSSYSNSSSSSGSSGAGGGGGSGGGGGGGGGGGC